MRYRLRTLLIVLALGLLPPLLCAGWMTYGAVSRERYLQQVKAKYANRDRQRRERLKRVKEENPAPLNEPLPTR